MPLLGGITRFLDKYLFGYALGVASGPSLAPFVQPLANEANATIQAMPLRVTDAATIVAEAVELQDWGRTEAAQTGHNTERFDALTSAVRNAPGLAELFETWRRDLIDDATFEHGLRKARLEPRWDAPLRALKSRLLSLEQLANARQQGFVTPARQVEESQLQGLDAERAEIAFELAGLPPGPETMQFAATRGLIDRGTFAQAIREGHTKTKYTDLLWEMRHPVLTAGEYATLHLKGWITADEMNTGGALHGYTPEQMNLLFLERGRPAAPGQMWTAIARGVDGPDGVPMNEPQFLKGIRESDIRPEWGPMLWDIRFAYPPLFQINRLRQADAISTATAVEWAHKNRYAPEVVRALEAYWSGGAATATTNPYLTKAQTQLWGTTHRSYIAAESNQDDARARFAALGVPATVQDEVLALWDSERELIRKQLTPAQIKKAFDKLSRNYATGAPWTRDDAIAALVARGYSVTEANDYLDIPSGR